MRRAFALAVILAIVAPAIAVCAGVGIATGTEAAIHDCCPKDGAATVSAPVEAGPDGACCRMSADAAHRAATTTAAPIAGQPVLTAIAMPAPAPIDLAPLRRPSTAPLHPPGRARHLLLSVLLV
jgi:hypothetical protein